MGNIIVTYVGRFQPFHKGHYATYMHLVKKFGKANVYIGTSDKVELPKSPFDFKDKKTIITSMFGIPKTQVVQVKNPYRPIEILNDYDEDSDILITVVGEKDSGRLGGKYFLPYTGNTDLLPFKQQGYVYVAPSLPNAISGTDVRDWLSISDENNAKLNFEKAYPNFDKRIYDLIRSKLNVMNEMAKADLDSVEKFADTNLAPYDFEFGREIDHFFQRLNDPRNGKEISYAEMIGFFKRLIRNRAAFDEFTKKYLEFVITDKRTNINIPFKTQANRLIAKTIMRKPAFKSPDPVLNIETIKKVGDDWVVYPKKGGKRLGTHDTKKAAIKQLQAIEINKESVEDTKNELRKLESERNRLFSALMKMFPNSPKQIKAKAELDSIMSKIKKLRTEALTENIILEGGAYGHMAHPFDIDMNLTFGDLKQIVKSALTGELELAREKTDGQALAISWKNGALISARNKGHLVNAGEMAMTEQDLIDKFAGRGALSDAFTFAIKDLKSAIIQLSNAERESIFKEGKAFMNCEVIYPENTNVIPYGQSLLVFHGTMEYDERGNPISEDPQAGFKLADMIEKVNANIQSRFKLQGPPVQTLPKSQDLMAKQPDYITKISKLQKEFGLNDANGVEDYHQAWWEQWINKNAPKDLSPDIRDGLVKRWAFFDKSFRLNQITDPDIRQWAEKTDKLDYQKISKTNLMKFEEIFLGVGADVLSFMSSVLVVNPEEAKRDIVDKLKNAISSIRATGDAKNLIKLELELKRLESLGGFEKIVPNEGIVFNYKGSTYKLTGAFAPLNQIMGVFTFTR